jgi:hypothetical protein
MKLLAHLVRADVRQFRWAILLWLVLVAAESVLTAMRPAFLDDLRVYAYIRMILGLLWYALQLAKLLLVPLVVQAHPAVGTDAFWMTRPIPPQTLFASKVALLATLTVLVPCATRLALMFWIQVPGREALLVALDGVIVDAAWLALLVAGAVVTLNLSRFALLCGAVFVSLMLFITVLVMRASAELDDAALIVAAGPPALPPADDPTGGIVFLLGVIAAGLGLAAIQYRTRLRSVSVPVGAGGLVLLALAIPYWPFPLLAVRSALPAWGGDPNAVQVQAPSPIIEIAPATGWNVEGVPTSRIGATRVTVGRLASGWLPRLHLLGASLTLDNGVSLAGRGRDLESMPQIEGSPDDPSRVVARDVLGVARVFVPNSPSPEAATILILPAHEIDPAVPGDGRYRGHFAVYLTHWEIAATVPVRAGTVFQDDDDHYRFAIEQVNTGPHEHMAVRAREWRATSIFDRKPRVAYAFYVRNARHSHAMAGYESEPFEGMSAGSGWLPFSFGSSSSGLARFFVRGALVSFPAPYGLREEKIDWDPAWYTDAELVIVRTTEAGAVLRTLDIPRASLVSKR